MLADFFMILLTWCAFLGFAAKRLLTYLHAFQQEEYDDRRFLNWIGAHKVFDKRLSLVILAIAAASLFIPRFLTMLLILFSFAVTAYQEKDPRRDSKKRLAMTGRAKRIFFTALGFCALAGALAFFTPAPLIWLIPVHLAPLTLVLANMALASYEEGVQKAFWNEAHAKLRDLNPTVIGVTGSFGKTSVKHILGHVLQSQAPTLVTPGSVNTPMGVTRIIRERLEPHHQYFIVEMGAYGPGSIERLCALTPPDLGIITAIGHAHYERFRSLDTVARTKFELALAVLGKKGKIIAHEKTLGFPYTQKILQDHKEHFIICGDTPPNGLSIESVRQTLEGLEVKVLWQDKPYMLEAPLFGAHHGVNMALAFAAACALGVEPDAARLALKSVPQIPHRLEVKRHGPEGAIIIDDAFNSNPAGFCSALDLLDQIGEKKRCILVTPGMVELGRKHDEIHSTVGAYAAGKCDLVIAVAPQRIKSFIDAYRAKANDNQKLMTVKSFAEAQSWLNVHMQKDDVILIENDLPDVYERVPRL